MANKNIDSTNLVIGPNTRVEKGEIKKLEINGRNIELANSVDIIDEYVDNLSLGSLNVGDVVTIPVEGYDGAKAIVLNITD